MRWIKGLWLIGIVGALCGCLGGDIVTPLEARQLKSRTEAYAALRERRADTPNSAWSAIPATGTATFDGVATLRVGPENARTRLVGDARINVDFENVAITGDLDHFFGVDDTRDLAEYSGSIQLSNGDIGAERPNAWTVEYDGTISGNNDRIVFDGLLIGDFQGTPVAVVQGRSSENDTALFNGQSTDVRVDVLAEQSR